MKKIRLVIRREQKSSVVIGGRIAEATAKANEITVCYKDLFLDPANPRLQKVHNKVTKNVADPAVQEFVESLMVRSNGRSVGTYENKLRYEGFMGNIAQIHVASVKGGYILCDGNTRVTAIRRLMTAHASKKIQLSPAVMATFKSLPVINLGKYGESETMLAWNAVRANMHILSPKAWGAYQKAAFVNYLHCKERLNVRDIQAMIGAQAATVKSFIEAFRMFDIIRKFPEYGSRIVERRFDIMREAVRNSKVRKYLEWDGRTGNPTKLRVFADLMAPRDGSIGYLGTGAQLPRLRALADNPNHWQAALDQRKNRKYLAQVQAIESGQELNKVALEFWSKVKKATPDDIEILDPKIINDIVSGCSKMLRIREKLAA
jgi:hypothetical protein